MATLTKFPSILKNYEMYIDGERYGQRVSMVRLPDNKEKHVEVNVGGTTRIVPVPVGFEGPMEVTFTTEGLDLDLLYPKGCGLGQSTIQFKGFAENPATCEEEAISVTFTGRLSVTPGEMTRGEGINNEASFMAITALYEVNGKEIYEERVLENVLRVNGKDLKAEERRALGYM